MKCTPPPKLPARPPLTVSIYKTLPDASNADLPPKPLITPTSLSPTRSRFRKIAPAPSPNGTPYGRKRTYSNSSDSIVVPLQYGEIAERAVKVRRTTLNNTNVNADSNNGAIHNYHSPPRAKIVYQQPSNMIASKTPRVKIQLIHDALLGGAKTLTTGDQDYLANQLHKDHPCISAMMMWLVAKQVTNTTYNLSYGVIHWAHRHSDLDLMEHMLIDRLYAFDMQEAFDEGLMGTKEVMDLMDCQLVLRCVRIERNERLKGAQKKSAEYPKTDHCESDAGSADMDLSEEDN